MNLRQLSLALFVAALSFSAGAATFSCPDLASTVQVNACPTEDELKFTYNGYCSDNAKAYANQTDSCIRYEDYRAMKNTARWESADGEFDGYVSCDLPAAQFKALKATSLKVVAQGKLTKLVCSYPKGINFTYRTKQTCTIDNEKACAADAANCKATCN
ncbi:hypothetical protein [Ferribacterium limneticum]|uniref:hypothetical protein n=1 Tax=Ferribacterium limneticum TaxID=76259 RepID=UPI001CFA7CC6|nr:hypothetical protein [Ferribacterium limneticum]UCV28389.1 hypothetical protein KI617_19450 [Ferribacterium limneticum]UCV32306.1 hypothetical protein KI608_19450 [Ferribacterium limneticum]